MLIATILLVQFVAFGGALLFGRIAERTAARKDDPGRPGDLDGDRERSAYFLPEKNVALFLGAGRRHRAGPGRHPGAVPVVLQPADPPRPGGGVLQPLPGLRARHELARARSIFGLVHQLTDSYRPAIFALIVFFVVGLVLLLAGRRAPRHRRGGQRGAARGLSRSRRRLGRVSRRTFLGQSQESRIVAPLRESRACAASLATYGRRQASRRHRVMQRSPGRHSSTTPGTSDHRGGGSMAERTLRGARLGGQSFEDERGIEFAARQRVGYECPQGHEFEIPMAAEADVPVDLGVPALRRRGRAARRRSRPRPRPRSRPAPTGTCCWSVARSRSSRTSSTERLELLRGGEIGPAHLHRAQRQEGQERLRLDAVA